MRKTSAIAGLRACVFGGALAATAGLAAEPVQAPPSPAPAASAVTVFAPTVSRVTVHPGWARIEREGMCPLQAGQTAVSFSPRGSRIVPGSVSAWVAGGDARVVGVQASERLAKEEHEAALRALAKEVATLSQALDGARSDQEGAKLDLAYLEKLTPWQAQEALPRERAVRQVTAAEVSELAEYLSKARTQALTRQAEAGQRLRAAEEELAPKQKELDDLRQRGPARVVAMGIDLAASAPGTARLTVSYTVPGASWYPQYVLDDSATPDGLRFRLVGVVQQATGEDWDQARVTLSLLPPLRGGAWRPEDAGWLVEVAGVLAQAPPESGYPAPPSGWKELTAAWTEWTGAKEPDAQAAAGARVRGNLAAAADLGRQLGIRGTAWELACTTEATIRADGSPTLVTAQEGDLTPKRVFHLAPGTSARAAVSGRARNAWPMAWLPGSVVTPRLGPGAALGTVPFTATGEEADVPLGPGETITGEKRVGEPRPAEAVAEGKVRSAWPCRLTVHNGGTEPAEVDLADCLPVADVGAEVRLTESAPRASVGPGGRLTWSLTVPPNGSLEVTYTVQAVYPADKPPALLRALLSREP